MLDTLGLSAEDERSLLEELITRGDRSSVYESLRNLWYALGEGRFLWDRREPIHPGTLLHPDSYGGQHIVEWRDQATWTAFLAHYSESIDTLIIRITTELSWLEPLLSDEDRGDLAQYHQSGNISLEMMRRLLNLRLHPQCAEFVALMEEYNWEWALAAVDWEDDGSPTFLEQLQDIVDDSTWSKAAQDEQQEVDHH